ncbi:chloroplast ABC1-like family protein [Hordeum vulgare]|nr:chloroplast ABC1-like family protein [Hordeum vulgare]
MKACQYRRMAEERMNHSDKALETVKEVMQQRELEIYYLRNQLQILKTGFFHADPHPRNLAIDKDGSLIYYDFGMMGEIKSFTRDRLLPLFYAVYEKDANKVIKALIDLEALQTTGDLSPVRRSVQYFLDNLLSQSQDQQQTLAAIGEDLFAIAQDQPFRFPSTFTFVIRAFSTSSPHPEWMKLHQVHQKMPDGV